VVLGYIAGLIDSVPMLARLVASRTAEAIHLSNRSPSRSTPPATAPSGAARWWPRSVTS
jgi:hypothetical protein